MGKRDIGVFIRDIIRKPPTAFPWIALFHCGMFLLVLLLNWGAPITDYFIEILWLVGFTTCWLYTCDLKKWAAYSYLGLTVANMVLFLIFINKPNGETLLDTYVSALVIPAFIFSFFILFFFRRFDQQ